MMATKTIPFLRLLKHTRLMPVLVRTLYGRKTPLLQCEWMGLHFSNPIGIAAGVDRRGEYTDEIANYSPSFIEIGPIRDVRYAINNLQNRQEDIIVMANLSNNKEIERSFSLLYDFVDAIVLNVSHNTEVSKIIDHLVDLRRYNDTYKPIIFKLFPDLDDEQFDSVATYMLSSGIDGVMVNSELVEMVRERTLNLLPVIAIAEISTPEDAARLLDTGADLVALTNAPLRYSPAFIKRILKYLEKR